MRYKRDLRNRKHAKSSHQNGCGTLLDASELHVIHKMNGAYKNLVRYQVEPERKNAELEKVQTFIAGMQSSMTDLLPYIDFDDCFGYVRRLDPNIEILSLSARDGEGLDRWVEWIVAKHPSALRTRLATMAVCVALLIGTLEWLQILSSGLGGKGAFRAWLDDLDFGIIGFAVVLIMLATWTLSITYYRLRVASRAALESNGD